MKLSKKIALSLFLATLFLMPSISFAQDSPTTTGLLPPCADTGACRVCDIVSVFINLGRWLITGAAGLALLIIVYAGTMMVISAGSSEKISAAKKQIIGAVVGLGLVLVAFQIVAFIIFAVTTPSGLQNSNTTQQPTSDKNGTLFDFLKVSWWTICDANELIAQNGQFTEFPSTANCTYWGDNTWCNEAGTKKCCAGVCASEGSEKDTYPSTEPKPVLIDGACFVPSLFRPQSPTGSFSSTFGKSEEQLREILRTSSGGKVSVNNNPCPLGDTTRTGCTNIAGLSQNTFLNIIALSAKCNCSVVISGGTEPNGHVSHGPNKPTIVDIRYSSEVKTALSQLSPPVICKDNFQVSGISLPWYVPETGPTPKKCDGSTGVPDHFHIQFAN